MKDRFFKTFITAGSEAVYVFFNTFVLSLVQSVAMEHNGEKS